MLEDRHPEESVRARVEQIDAIEALRAVAATWVVVFHYLVVREAAGIADPWNAWVAASAAANAVVRNGYLGVDLFFLITGFLLVLPWAQGAAPRARDFYVRRIRRIVPAYYVQLLLLFALFLPLLQSLHHAWNIRGLVALNALAHATFLHYTTPVSSASLGLNGALWTLTLEAQFYLLLPLLAPLFVRAPVASCVALGAIAAGWRWLTAHDLEALVSLQMAIGSRWDVPEAAVRHLLLTQLPGYLGHFAAGMAMGLAWMRRGQRHAPRTRDLPWTLAAAAGLAALYWTYALGGGQRLGTTGGWLLCLTALSVVMFAGVRGGLVARALVHRPTLFVGRISYSVYLYHVPLLLAWNRWAGSEGRWWSLPAYFAVVLAAGWLSYTFVEKPFLHRRRERARPL